MLSPSYEETCLFSRDFSFIYFYYTITFTCMVNSSFGKRLLTKVGTDVTEPFWNKIHDSILLNKRLELYLH